MNETQCPGAGPLLPNGIYRPHKSFGPRVRRSHRPPLRLDDEPGSGRMPTPWLHLVYVLAVMLATLAAVAIFLGGFPQ